MQLLTIRELKQQVPAEPGRYLVQAQVEAVKEKTTRSGNPFYEVKLADAEDQIVLKAWSDSPEFRKAENLAARAFIEVTADWEDTGKYGLDGKNWEARTLDEAEIEAMLGGGAALREKQAADYAHIQSECAALADPRLRALCLRFLEKFGDRYRRAGAARKFHHARRGGLVEHVAQMMRGAGAVASVYENLNRDLLIAGVLFHDCGKISENGYEAKGFVMPYTEAGEMIGHISIGMEIVNLLWREVLETDEAAAWKTLDPPNDKVRLHLLHLIASHHGEREFGSPVTPATPEASALHYIDNLDAKMEMFAAAYETSPEIGKDLYERVFPLQGNLAKPLPKFE